MADLPEDILFFRHLLSVEERRRSFGYSSEAAPKESKYSTNRILKEELIDDGLTPDQRKVREDQERFRERWGWLFPYFLYIYLLIAEF